MTGPNLRRDSHFYKDMDSWICITQKIAATLSLCAFYRLAGGRREYFWKKYTKKTWRHFCVHACAIENNWTTKLLYNRVQNTLIVLLFLFFFLRLFSFCRLCIFLNFTLGMSGCLDVWMSGSLPGWKKTGVCIGDGFLTGFDRSCLPCGFDCVAYIILSFLILYVLLLLLLVFFLGLHSSIYSHLTIPPPLISLPPLLRYLIERCTMV
jgi:hypothetical protein